MFFFFISTHRIGRNVPIGSQKISSSSHVLTGGSNRLKYHNRPHNTTSARSPADNLWPLNDPCNHCIRPAVQVPGRGSFGFPRMIAACWRNRTSISPICRSGASPSATGNAQTRTALEITQRHHVTPVSNKRPIDASTKRILLR